MWVPLIQSMKLREAPVRVSYWGTPVVLYRTRSGELGALEDICPHRGVPLSRGVVHGEHLRCGFHHFTFDRTGQCTSIPADFRVSAGFKRGCTVRRFFVREALGLIWVSVESEATAPFPIDLDALPERPNVVTGSFEVQGDLRVWMDHFLDATHCLWTHAETSYGGSADRAARMSDVRVGIDARSAYPVRPGVEMTYTVDSTTPQRVRYSPILRLLASIAAVRRGLRVRPRGRHGAPRHVHIRADLLTPLCQYTYARYGAGNARVSFEGVTAIHPVGPGRHEFHFATFFHPGSAGPIGRSIERMILDHFVRQHLGVEDARLLADAVYVEGERFQRTPLDTTVDAMRVLFNRYRREKAHLYPEGSLIHTLGYGSDDELGPRRVGALGVAGLEEQLQRPREDVPGPRHGRGQPAHGAPVEQPGVGCDEVGR
jgi:phenylpropionate dioxygenase-like ring-hydroxylating dioxygenase large terminal subunit